MSESLKHQVAIVTGGNAGLGRAITFDLARQGAKVIIIGRNESKNSQTVDEIRKKGGYADAYKVDVTDAAAVNEATQAIYKKHHRIDILVNNAGILPSTGEETIRSSVDDWMNVLHTNLTGCFYFSKSVGEIMTKRKYGRIVMMSSIAGIHGCIGGVSYATSKHGLIGMMYTLAKELGPHGITVNAIQPGVINTAMAEGLSSEQWDGIIRDTPMRRVGTPEDVAYAVSCLCQPEAGFLNGVTIQVDGGYVRGLGAEPKVKVIEETQLEVA